MYQRILVAIDASGIGQQVLDAAISLAKATGGTLHLLRVLSYEDEQAPGLKEKGTPEYDRRWTEFEKDGNTLLSASLEQVQAAGIVAEGSLLPGKPGRLICELAEQWTADTIIIGRRQLTGLKQLLLGSVSNYVVHSAPCSVLVIQGSDR
jgi:nucleotide-binding universal stress UspA family protein